MIDRDLVLSALTQVLDPELGLNVVELGLIQEILEPAPGDLVIRMTMTTPGCPMHDSISESVNWAVMHVPNVSSVRVDVVWDSPWTPDCMTEEARAKLGF